MLIKSVHINIKTLVYFFMEGRHSTVPIVKMADTLANYICNFKVQLKFSLKLKVVSFNKIS